MELAPAGKDKVYQLSVMLRWICVPAVGSAFREAGNGGRFTSAAGVVNIVGMVGAVTECDTRVASRSMDPAPQQGSAPYSGLAMAEHLSGDGLHALELPD